MVRARDHVFRDFWGATLAWNLCTSRGLHNSKWPSRPLEHHMTTMSLKITVKEASKLPNIRLTALGTSDPLAVVKF